MTYQETTIHKITFTYDDIRDWAKTNASRQLGISVNEITDDMITISPPGSENVAIGVEYTKVTSNNK